MRKLHFRILKVRCTDETGGRFQEAFGSDDTFLAAVTVGADKSVEIIPAFHVGQFDDKTTKIFDPPKAIAEFDLAKGGNFPKTYFVHLVLIERDSGDNIKPFLETLKDKVKEAVGKADDATGNESTSSSGWVDVLKEVAIEIAKFLWKDARKDDIFPPDQAFITIPKADFTWLGGENHSPREFSKFEAHNGKYSVYYDWLITG